MDRVKKVMCSSQYKFSQQFNSVAQSCLTCNPMDCSMAGFSVHHNSHSLLKLLSIKSVMPSSQLILCHPLLLLPSIFPSIRVFSNELTLHIRQTNYWSFSFSISPSNEYSGLISFRMDWLDNLAVQGTLKSLFLHHSSKASILQCSGFFMVQLSHRYMTTEKNHSFDYRLFCQESDVSAFQYAVQVCHSFSSKEQASFNFLAAVTICSDFVFSLKQ